MNDLFDKLFIPTLVTLTVVCVIVLGIAENHASNQFAVDCKALAFTEDQCRFMGKQAADVRGAQMASGFAVGLSATARR